MCITHVILIVSTIMDQFQFSTMENMQNGESSISDLSFEILDLDVPHLSELAEVLQNGMQPLFHELKVDIASCPCLTKEPYNLVGVGLCGKTRMIEFCRSINSPTPWYDSTLNISDILSKNCRDSFIIGSGYAAKPHMPYNGQLIMNAMYRAPRNITNASRIVFADSGNGQRRIETITNPETICSYYGSFFISEGRPGKVIRVRAKGRRNHNTDIITSMQTILFNSYCPNNYTVALGGVLRMRNGRAAYNVMSEEYPEHIVSYTDFVRQYQCHEIDIESDLVAVGTLRNYKPEPLRIEQRYGLNLYNTHYFFSFSNGAGGQFISDTTPDITEYEGYFNLLQEYINPDNDF